MVELNTQIVEPSLTAGEAEMLLFAVERSRAQFAWKVGGLDAEALRRRPLPSSMSLAGLIKHLALVEDANVATFVRAEPLGAPWNAATGSRWAWAWETAQTDDPDDLYRLWADAAERNRTAWRSLLAEGGLDRPSALVLDDGGSPNLRRALVDLHDEYARHVGHADLLREAIDGLTGEDPPHDR